MSPRSDANQRGSLGTGADIDLVAGMLLNDSDALAALIRRYARLVYRVAADILHDAGEAEDVTQEIFWEVYRKAHLYDPSRGSVRVWLLQYAYHRSLRRKDALRVRVAYRGEPLEYGEALPHGHRAGLTRQESRWVIRAGLTHLPERQRLTIELTCFEDLSLREIAERLGVSLGCVRHYYYRGLARLRAWAQVATAIPKQRGGNVLGINFRRRASIASQSHRGRYRTNGAREHRSGNQRMTSTRRPVQRAR